MRSFRRSIALAVSIALVVPPVVLAMPGEASAQPKKPQTIRESLPPEARGHWDAGLVLAQKQQWAQAAASFKAAYEASNRNPRVLFNLSVAERGQKRYGAGYEALVKEQAEGKGLLTADEENELKTAIASLKNFVVELKVQVNEPGAEVFIGDVGQDNDEKLDVSKLPGPYFVSLGKKRVRATKVGFAEAVEVKEFAGNSQGEVTLKLQPLVRTARVNVNVIGPGNAIVKIDGNEVGPAPYAGQVKVAAEPHQFSAEAPGFVTATQSAIVKEGEVLNLSLQLSADQEKGKLLVIAKPEGATIEIDGKVAGATRWEGPVDARVHQVVVKKQGFYTWTYDVDVPRGSERSVTAALNEDRNTSFVPWLIGSIVIGSALIGAIVFLASPPDEEAQKGTLSPFVFGTSNFQPGLRF